MTLLSLPRSGLVQYLFCDICSLFCQYVRHYELSAG